MMMEHLQRLAANFRAGIRLASFRPVTANDFHDSPDQLVLLLCVDFLAAFSLGYFTSLPYPEFNPYAIPVFGYHCVLLLGTAYLITRILDRSQGMLLFPVAILSLLPAIYLVWMPLGWLLREQLDASQVDQWILYGAYLLWIFVMAVRNIGFLRPATVRRHVEASTAILLAWLAPSTFFSEYHEFWYKNSSAADDAQEDAYAAYRKLDVESIFYHQPELLNASLASIQTERPDITDLYFVGFAGYARQNVFNTETQYARTLFDSRFDTQGRSIVLTNHLDHYTTTPLANSHNLAATLKTIGTKMNTADDVLVLYLTSHGSKKHELSVNFWPLQLNDITPTMLKHYLDDAGIKWRVILVSACYSGGFVEPLRDAYSIVATASAADRTSFGCGDHNDFTYFGEAVFKDQLSKHYSLPDALHAASETIALREQQEKLQASEPQTFIGEEIARKLERVETRLRQRACSDGAAEPSDITC